MSIRYISRQLKIRCYLLKTRIKYRNYSDKLIDKLIKKPGMALLTEELEENV